MTTQIATTNINVIPQRIESDHYRTPSFTDPSKTYDQIYNHNLRRWLCNCADAQYGNPNCKHNILLRAHIKQASQQAPAPEKQHSSSQELISILERLAKLENAQESTERENLLLQRDLEEHEALLDSRAEQERQLRQQLAQQQQQINELTALVKRQQEYIDMFCNRIPELNSITDRQRQSIEDISGIVAREIRLANERIDDQAQQIDRLHDQISSQPKQVEQVVRVVVDGAKATAEKPAAKRGRPKAAEQVEEAASFLRVLQA